MDNYLQTTAVLNSLSRNGNRTTTSNSSHSPSLSTKLLRPYPPSNTEPVNNKICAPEGVYNILEEIFIKTIVPHFATGTHATITHSHFKETTYGSLGPDTQPSSTSSSTSEAHGQDDGPPPFAKLSETQTNGHVPGIHIIQSEALPIPQPKKASNNNSSSSSSSSLSSPPADDDDLRDIPFHLQNTNSNHSAFSHDLHAHLASSLSHTLNNNGSYQGNQLVPSLSVESRRDDLSSSPGGNSSVGSFSSLFSRSHRHHASHRSRKPKNSLAKCKSSLIERVFLHDQFETLILGKAIEEESVFFNVGMSFVWMNTNSCPKEPLARITFAKAHPTCHDVNTAMGTMDVIIGFSSGDCLWYDPLSHRYSRINKNGVMKSASVTMVKWMPGSEDLFMASFSDGSMMILDKEHDDQPFTSSPLLHSWNEAQFEVTKPQKHSRHNPVSHWRVSAKGVAAFAFSPDALHIATVGKDGYLRIIDYTKEKICAVFGCYYGNLQCVAWSPDGKYLLTGGQDDLVTIWSFQEQRIVARCQGHKSWVTGVAFDPWRCDEKVYRFSSVGEDCNLIMWDFSVSALHRPKHKSRRLSTLSKINTKSTVAPSAPLHSETRKERWRFRMFGLSDDVAGSTFRRFRKQSTLPAGLVDPSIETTAGECDDMIHAGLPSIHPPLKKTEVPFLQPISVQTIHEDPCMDIVFKEHYLLTTDRRGRVRKWGRPHMRNAKSV